ncbi:MAG: hypothetical protein H7329_16860 [Opitutaceae bacterium]|nr:hypothetical protein [Cytophagales bacterium]
MIKFKYIYKYFILLACFSLLTCQRKSHEMNPGIKVHFNKLNIIWNGVNRLTGVVPVLENTNIKCHEVHTIENDTNYTFEFLHNFEDHVEIKARISPVNNSIIFHLSPNNYHTQKASDFVGMLFDEIPNIDLIQAYNKGVPLEVKETGNLKDSTDYLIIKYSDQKLGAFIPLNGKGYKSGIGNYKGLFGVKSYHTKDGHNENEIPIAFLVFADDKEDLRKKIISEPLLKNLQVSF